jgi:hypothetical protein
MNKLIATTLLACWYSTASFAVVFFSEDFEIDPGDKVFKFTSYLGNRGIPQDETRWPDPPNPDQRTYEPTYFTGERVFDSGRSEYVWKNTFLAGCTDTYFGHSKRISYDSAVTNTLHWRAYVKFVDEQHARPWEVGNATNQPDCPTPQVYKNYELKFPDVGWNNGESRIIGKFRELGQRYRPGIESSYGRFYLYVRHQQDSYAGNHPSNAGDHPELFLEANQWYAIEFMVEDNGDTDTIKIWINNNNQDNPDYSFTSDFDMFDLSTMVNSDGEMKWEHAYRNHAVSRDMDFYYDDVVISDSFIGTGDSAAPALSENSYVVLNPVLTSASVVSLADNNRITAGGSTLDLNLYGRGVFQATTGVVLNQGTIISGTRPFDIASGRDGTDMPVHTSMLGTAFAMPHTRGSHLYYMMSPSEAAVANINVNGEHRQVALSPGQVRRFNAGAANGAYGAVITSDVPIIISHLGRNAEARWDASPMPPAATDLWGIRSTNATVIAVEDDTQVHVYTSNGETETMTLQAGQKRSVTVGASTSQGRGSAVHLVANRPISAVQQADGDGIEQTAFYPRHMLSQRYGIPIDAQYVAAVCVEPNTSVTLYLDGNDGAGVTKTCTVTDDGYPGKLFFGVWNTNGYTIGRGSYLESTSPVHVIYEASGSEDEHNLMGAPAL